MKLKIHRGAHEIGGSCVEVSVPGGRLVLDLGMPLVKKGKPTERFELKEFAALSGPELVQAGVLPPVAGLYAWDKDSPPVDGLVISHAHLDHWGFLRYVRPGIPVFASEGTRILMEVSAIFLPGAQKPPSVTVLQKWKPTRIGAFTVTGHLVDHSAPDALALEVEAGGSKLFYSGDLRAHGRKGKLFENMVRRPPREVDCLLLEGTMMDRGPQRFETEEAVEEGFWEWCKKPLPVVVFCSSQNIDRLCSAYRAAIRSGRQLVMDLYTAFVLDRLRVLSDRLPQYDAANIRVMYWHSHASVIADAGHQQFLFDVVRSRIRIPEIAAAPERFLVLARANRLFTILGNQLPAPQKAVLVWSMWEKYLTGKDSVSRFAAKHGLEIQHIHTSGHATVDDLRRLVKAVDPMTVVPIHTFSPEKYHGISDRVVQVRDGEELEV